MVLAMRLALALAAAMAAGVLGMNDEEAYFDADRVAPKFDGTPIMITPENHDVVKNTWHYLFVDFYADWCPYCRRLKPVWDQVSHDLVGLEDAAMAMVNCVAHPKLAEKYGITKFPTMKMIRAGEASKKEYRGSRTAEAITKFMHEQVDAKSNHATSSEQLENFVEEGDKRIIVGFFTTPERSRQRIMFERMSDHMRDDCKFIEVNDPDVMRQYGVDDGSILYKTDHDHDLDEQFKFENEDNAEHELLEWAYDKCVPLVKEATHFNVEGFAEEGKPFFIMFYDDQEDDGSSVRIFKAALETDFGAERENFNFLYADGNTFTHPLRHMGMTKKDMPVVAIDTFRTMYRFGNFKCFAIPEVVHQFVQDFKSGKLHKNMLEGTFHPYECDEQLDALAEVKVEILNQLDDLKEEGNPDKEMELAMRQLEHLTIISDSHEEEKIEKETKRKMAEAAGVDHEDYEKQLDQRVHDSVFAKLKPGAGSGRYSMMRDEL